MPLTVYLLQQVVVALKYIMECSLLFFFSPHYCLSCNPDFSFFVLFSVGFF